MLQHCPLRGGYGCCISTGPFFLLSHSCTSAVPWHRPLPSQTRKARSWSSHGGATVGAVRAGEQCCSLQRCCVSSEMRVLLCCQSSVRMLLPLWETKWPLSKENLAAIAGPTVLLGYFGEGREYPESRASWYGSCGFHNSLLAPHLCHVKGSPHLISAQLSFLPICWVCGIRHSLPFMHLLPLVVWTICQRTEGGGMYQDLKEEINI